MKKIFLLVILFMGLHIQAQTSNPKADLQNVFKADLVSVYYGVVSLSFEKPVNHHSFLYTADVGLGFTAFGFGFNYNYYIFDKAPYGLYLSPGIELLAITTDNPDVGLAPNIAAGYQYILPKQKFVIDLKVGVAAFAFQIINQKPMGFVGFSLGFAKPKK